jgi:hypothetical protein
MLAIVPFGAALALFVSHAPVGSPSLLLSAFHVAGERSASGVSMQLSIPLDAAASLPPRSTAAAPHRFGFALSSRLARDVVAAAIRAASLHEDDAYFDGLKARARISGLLPEARFRIGRTTDATATQSSTAQAQSGADPSEDTFFGSRGRLYLEARLAFRLDRLLFADEEPAIERLRQEVREREQRVTHRALEALFIWQRAELDARDNDSTEVALHLVEALATLDVLTNGWFSRRRHNLPSR